MVGKGTLIPASTNQVPKYTMVIPSFAFLKKTYLPSGEFEKLKARLVAGRNPEERESYIQICLLLQCLQILSSF